MLIGHMTWWRKRSEWSVIPRHQVAVENTAARCSGASATLLLALAAVSGTLPVLTQAPPTVTSGLDEAGLSVTVFGCRARKLTGQEV